MRSFAEFPDSQYETHVIANQCRSTGVAPSGDSLRSQSVFQAFPSDEGGSRVPRKRKTDEGKTL